MARTGKLNKQRRRGLVDKAAKRALDIAGSTAALSVLGGPMLAIAAVSRVKIGSPVLFTQIRPGEDGELFAMHKFRTMTDARDADGNLLPDADRLVAWGQFLRSTSLDELPEFLDVLLGKMSLVGPRPLLKEYLDRYSEEQMRRHDVKPGITGWAQINGRNAISWDEKFAHDLWYVENWSVALDLYILVQTVLKVLRRDGISADGEATMPIFMGSDAEATG